jgi:hypothetical protein
LGSDDVPRPADGIACANWADQPIAMTEAGSPTSRSR